MISIQLADSDPEKSGSIRRKPIQLYAVSAVPAIVTVIILTYFNTQKPEKLPEKCKIMADLKNKRLIDTETFGESGCNQNKDENH